MGNPTRSRLVLTRCRMVRDMKVYLKNVLLAVIAVPFLSAVPPAGPQMNDSGGPEAEMLASAAIAGEFHDVALTVPEPGTMIIFATGLFGLGVVRAWRRSA